MNATTTRRPRIVFVTAPGPQAGSTVVTWRMLAANNRAVANGTTAHPSVAACRETVRLAQAAHGDLAVSTFLAGARESWRWRVSLHGEAVAGGVRAYSRRFECARTADQFVTLLVDVEIDERSTRQVDRPGLQRLLHSGSAPRGAR